MTVFHTVRGNYDCISHWDASSSAIADFFTRGWDLSMYRAVVGQDSGWEEWGDGGRETDGGWWERDRETEGEGGGNR